MLEEMLKVLLNNGPMGIVAGVAFYLLLKEQNSHKETRDKLDKFVEQQSELTEKAIETMTRVSTLVSERLPNKN